MDGRARGGSVLPPGQTASALSLLALADLDGAVNGTDLSVLNATASPAQPTGSLFVLAPLSLAPGRAPTPPSPQPGQTDSRDTDSDLLADVDILAELALGI